ncbi:hypothetical protein CDAR_29771 [Caerostris darwini]|uniref:Uncharacterized protein n=1 Tax=Caerostris darwini TaxID=1538125 RepID=A0AAV4QUT5_9ARAC|nr:hypothetical protein CDAR_29771 [Caerostris darwini]
MSVPRFEPEGCGDEPEIEPRFEPEDCGDEPEIEPRFEPEARDPTSSPSGGWLAKQLEAGDTCRIQESRVWCEDMNYRVRRNRVEQGFFFMLLELRAQLVNDCDCYDTFETSCCECFKVEWYGDMRIFNNDEILAYPMCGSMLMCSASVQEGSGSYSSLSNVWFSDYLCSQCARVIMFLSSPVQDVAQ